MSSFNGLSLLQVRHHLKHYKIISRKSTCQFSPYLLIFDLYKENKDTMVKYVMTFLTCRSLDYMCICGHVYVDTWIELWSPSLMVRLFFPFFFFSFFLSFFFQAGCLKYLKCKVSPQCHWRHWLDQSIGLQKYYNQPFKLTCCFS